MVSSFSLFEYVLYDIPALGDLAILDAILDKD